MRQATHDLSFQLIGTYKMQLYTNWRMATLNLLGTTEQAVLVLGLGAKIVCRQKPPSPISSIFHIIKGDYNAVLVGQSAE